MTTLAIAIVGLLAMTLGIIADRRRHRDMVPSLCGGWERRGDTCRCDICERKRGCHE
jgi:hypothetical protein